MRDELKFKSKLKNKEIDVEMKKKENRILSPKFLWFFCKKKYFFLMHSFTVGYRAVKSPVCVKKSLKQLIHILATNLKIIFLKSP